MAGTGHAWAAQGCPIPCVGTFLPIRKVSTSQEKLQFLYHYEVLTPGQLCSSNPQAHSYLRAFAHAILAA